MSFHKCNLYFPGSGTKSTDQDLLALRATSIATVGCLEECLYALQLEQRSLVKQDVSPASSSGMLNSTFYVNSNQTWH